MKHEIMHYSESELSKSCGILTQDQANKLFTSDEIAKGEKRGYLKTRGIWKIPVSYTALAVDKKTNTIYGMRTLQDVQSLGYELEGRVKVGGNRVRGFTSSMLFQLPDGKLIDVAIIYCCMDQPK